MKRISIDELKQITDECLVLQCRGDPQEWINGINAALTERGTLFDGNTIQPLGIFEHDGLTNMLFSMNDVNKLAAWRLESNDNLKGIWLSNYLSYKFDITQNIITSSEDMQSIVVNDRDAAHAYSPYSQPKQYSLIQAYIVNTDDMVKMFGDISRLRDRDYGGKWLSFPTTAEAFQTALREIGIDGARYSNIHIRNYRTELSGLQSRLSAFADINEFNYFAARLVSLTEAQHNTFEAVMESGRHCDNVAELINVIENLDSFYLQPALDASMYGDFLLDTDKDNTSAVFRKLEMSGYSDERELAQYILRLEASVDAKSYGRAAAERENGVFTHYGYLTESDGFEEIYRGAKDIPAEYRVYPPADGTLPIKVHNTDLTDLVIKMHALGGDYMSPAQHHVRMLTNGDNADYLLMMTNNTIFLYGAGECFLHQEEGCQNWLTNTSESKRAFVISVRDSKDGRVFGDISEADFDELRQDIARHAIHCERVEAVLEDGTERVSSEAEWDCVSAEERDALQEYTIVYNPDDIRELNAHLQKMRHSRENEGRVMSPDEFLQRLNAGFMAAAENPQPDMLRVDRKVAWQMLARSDAPVYRLTSDGPVGLRTFDILRSKGGSWPAEYREFAIKNEDREGFDEWADRAFCDALRPIERGGPGKNKSRGEEH